jgi:hypothetical protein
MTELNEPECDGCGPALFRCCPKHPWCEYCMEQYGVFDCCLLIESYTSQEGGEYTDDQTNRDP